MKEQEIFDAVVAHSRTMKTKAKMEGIGGQCMYRAPDGQACFIGGPFIRDEDYSAKLEIGVSELVDELEDSDDPEGHVFGGNALGPLAKALGNTVGTLTLGKLRLMDKLQTVHDCSEMDRWEERLATVARNCDLEYTPPA